MLYDLENGNTMIIESDKDEPEFTLYVADDRGIKFNIKIELQILYNVVAEQYYVANRNNANIYCWGNSAQDIINKQLRIVNSNIFIKKISLIDRLFALEDKSMALRTEISFGLSGHASSQKYNDLCDLITKVHFARIRITDDLTGLTKDEITYFNKMIKKYKIKI